MQTDSLSVFSCLFFPGLFPAGLQPLLSDRKLWRAASCPLNPAQHNEARVNRKKVKTVHEIFNEKNNKGIEEHQMHV